MSHMDGGLITLDSIYNLVLCGSANPLEVKILGNKY